MILADERQCEILKALADETRLRLLRLLYNEELNVQELCEILDLPQPKVSRHLSVLRKASLVKDRRNGSRVFYCLNEFDKKLAHFSDLLAQIGGADHPDLEKMENCLRQRRITPSAVGWDEKVQELYNPLTALPALANLAPRGLTIADFGTGTGRLLPVLSQFADEVYAIDYSKDMLDFARERCKQLNITNVKFIHADLEKSSFYLPPCDGIIMHFVIHQLPSPANAISSVARFLKPGGRLVIIDRLKHQDEDARKQFGSFWLGFEQEQLNEWLMKSGLKNFNWNVNPDLNTPVPVFTASAQN